MEEYSTVFKSLGDETRLRILALLCAEGELCICEIVETLNLPQSTASRHVSSLKNAGWIKDRKKGVWRFYAVREDLDEFKKSLLSLLCQYFATDSTFIDDERRLKCGNIRSKCVTTERDTEVTHCEIS